MTVMFQNVTGIEIVSKDWLTDFSSTIQETF